MKKLISMGLALVMLMALAVPALAADTVTLYCEAPTEWTSCYAYWWGGSNTPEWPGLKMDNAGDGLWSYAIPADAKNIIFSDGNGTQTADLPIPTSGKNTFNVTEKRWKGGEPVPVDYYLVGYLNGADYGIGDDSANLGDYRFVDNKVTASFTQKSYVLVKDSDGIQYKTMAYSENTSDVFCMEGSEKMAVPENQTLTFTLVINDDGTLTLSYQTACEHNYKSNITKEAKCEKTGVKTYTCTKCNHSYIEDIPATGHQFVSGVCTVCNKNKDDIPPVTWYLVGYINGKDVGIADDSANLGEHQFKDGEVEVSIDSDSYVVVKNNSNEVYMTDALCEETTGTLRVGGTEKIKVPGGQSYRFTLKDNGDGTLTLSYQSACDHDYKLTNEEAANCGEPGKKEYTCTKCGDGKEETIPATGNHNFVDGVCSICKMKEEDVKPVDNDPNKVTLFAKVPEAWTEVHAYTWSGEEEFTGKWPGNPMEKDGKWYRIVVDAKAANAVINNGSDQQKTQDQKIDTQYDIYITVNEDGTATVEPGAKNETAKEPDCEHTFTEKIITAATCAKAGTKTKTCTKCGDGKEETIPATGNHNFVDGVCSICKMKEEDVKPVDNDPNKVTLFAKVPEAWTEVHAYAWNGETQYTGEWPGTAMKKNGGWYSIEIDPKATNVIVNNGSDQQKTQDQTVDTKYDIYITVNEDGTAKLETGAANDTGAKDFPLSNFRVVGNASWMGDWKPDNEAGRMRECGTNRYFLEVKDVPAGTYEFKITENGTWDRCWGEKDGKNKTFTLSQKSNVTIYFELNGDDYKIEVDLDPNTSDIDMIGVVVLMGMAVLAVGVLLINRKKFLK